MTRAKPLLTTEEQLYRLERDMRLIEQHVGRRAYRRNPRLPDVAVRVKVGILDALLTPIGEVDMSVYTGDPLVDSGEKIPVRGWLLGASGQSIPPNTRVKAEFLEGAWYVTVSACQADP